MIDFYFRMILGHLIGDYLIQNDWMALNKKDKWLPCVGHCYAYMTVMLICLFPEVLAMNPLMIVITAIGIFLSHLVLDKTKLIDKWLNFIGSRSWKNTLIKTSQMKTDIEKQAYVSFTALVQTAADNTMHLVLLYILFKLLFILCV